jgi:hypothetical protein
MTLAVELALAQAQSQYSRSVGENSALVDISALRSAL